MNSSPKLSPQNVAQWEGWMELARQQAQNAFDNNEVPVGAVVIGANGEELSRSYNLKEASFNPCAHAEILAIQEACQKQKNWRLTGCQLVVTLEPCPMCLAASQQARLERIIFGAYDPKGGALSLGYGLHQDARLNHRLEVIGGIQDYECGKLLSSFFKQRRQGYSDSRQ